MEVLAFLETSSASYVFPTGELLKDFFLRAGWGGYLILFSINSINSKKSYNKQHFLFSKKSIASFQYTSSTSCCFLISTFVTILPSCYHHFQIIMITLLSCCLHFNNLVFHDTSPPSRFSVSLFNQLLCSLCLFNILLIFRLTNFQDYC